jgi:hypothetical protein
MSDSILNKQEWYKNLDISSKGKPLGIDRINEVSSTGICYCLMINGDTVEQVDVYQDGRKINYKKFTYDTSGCVIENAMYSPDGSGGWHITDDIWYYEYHPTTGLRTKKIMKLPGASTAQEILYNEEGQRISERTIITK